MKLTDEEKVKLLLKNEGYPKIKEYVGKHCSKRSLKMFKKEKDVIYDENVDYDSLEQHKYLDTPGYTFYKCPKCGRYYLATFITEENGDPMCVEYWSRLFGD